MNFMNSINGKRLYCRTIEKRILTSWKNDVKHESKLSIRDNVTVSIDGAKNYRLWNTDLVRYSSSGDVYINVTGNRDMEYRYYHYGRTRDYIITNTTKRRLNAFLNYYGFNSLEVHSSRKDWSVRYNGEKLEVDSWYKLDFENNKLLKVADSERF